MRKLAASRAVAQLAELEILNKAHLPFLKIDVRTASHIRRAGKLRRRRAGSPGGHTTTEPPPRLPWPVAGGRNPVGRMSRSDRRAGQNARQHDAWRAIEPDGGDKARRLNV